MPSVPWWIERVEQLLTPSLTGLSAGPLWNLSERLQFIRENVQAELLPVDFQAHAHAAGLWSAFEAREAAVLEAVSAAVLEVGAAIRSGVLGPEAFRFGWEKLGFLAEANGAATPADDYLDAVCHVARLTLGEQRPPSGMLNMASRAQRISDFLSVTEPGPEDLVYDLGSGNGKFTLTVAASSFTQVRGVELGESYVAAARASVTHLGLQNLVFHHADVREVDLSEGTIFYLYYPFNGAVAQSVAVALGRLARDRKITVYLSGPTGGFGEHFLGQVENGALRLMERRGEFSEVLVLRSANA